MLVGKRVVIAPDEGTVILGGGVGFVSKLYGEENGGAFAIGEHPLEPGILGGPTRENIESILRLNADPELPELIFGTPDGFFGRMSASGLTFPTVHDELQHHAVGCYSAHSGVKRLNRRAENALISAEKFCAIAQRVTGQKYPEDFDLAWKAVLFNQFHDILAGTSLEAAYEDARDGFGEAMSIAGRNLNYAVQSISWSIGIEQDGTTPIVIFNPHSWPSLAGVELEFGSLTGEEVLLDDEDRLVPLQTVRSRAATRGRNRLNFVARLPAMGYRVYRVAPGTSTEDHPPLQADGSSAENDRFRLSLDADTGSISSLYDKKKQIEVFGGPAARPVVVEDQSDTWSHGVVRFGDEIGAFYVERIGLVEQGPVKAVLRVESRYGSSRLVQDFTVYAGLDRVDVEVTVDWREQFEALKLRFPVNLDLLRATFEIPYGSIEREVDGAEQPGQGWLDLSGIMPETGETYGLSILNDGKYGFDVRDEEVGLTVLRSPIYAHHDPFVPQPDESYSFVDQGIQRFTYALLPHSGGWEAAGTVRQAAELNQRPIVVMETYHEGPLPEKDSYLSVEPDNVIVEVLKRAEDDDDLIVRCREACKKATRAKIQLPRWAREIEADFAPCEIKTFRVPRDENLPVIETNLLELEEPEE